MALIPPPWEQTPEASASPEAPRAPNGQFLPGTVPNPKGRPPGIVDRRNRVAKAFDAEFDAIGAALVERAKAGDVAAIALYLSRVEPPLRPKGERTPFVLDTTQPLAVQAAQVVQAVADGHLSAEAAQTVLACLNTYAQLAQHDQLEARLQALERATRVRDRARGANSSVVLVEHPGAPQ